MDELEARMAERSLEDFRKRRDAAITEMDKILQKYEVGLTLVINTGQVPGVISELKPAIRYRDLKGKKTGPVESAPKANGKGKTKKTGKK